MKKRISYILVLMSLCVFGITGLQLYWNYRNYQSTTAGFRHDINEALRVAVDREIDTRHDSIAIKFRTWLNDTSFVQINVNRKNRKRETVFHMKDTHPLNKDERGVSLSINDFKEPLDSINPRAKKIFIDHFTDVLLKEDLKKGIVYFYTQRLGDSLSVIYNRSNVDLSMLNRIYRQELEARGIRTPFVLNPAKSNAYVTQPVNTALRRPYEKNFVTAAFESPDLYFLKEMKWLLLTSLLLILVTLACFAYTVITLLSQQKLNTLKDDFISNMTHELNTPLSSIKITAEALRTLPLNEGSRREYIDIIAYQSEKLSELTAQILDGQQLQQKNHLQKKRTDVNLLIQNIITDLAPQINHSGANISIDANTEPVYILADAGAVQHALTNLIDNAIKYSDGSAVIMIATSLLHNKAVITVSDNGIGIPTEYHNRIFDKFFRVPKGNLHDVKGYGLGLDYVRQVITQHSGSITISGNHPLGTVFTIQIPLV